MQIGQVPIMFVPDAPVNDVQSRTEDVDTGNALIPSLQVFAPAPVVIDEPPEVAPWLWGAILFGAALFWLMPRR